MDYKVQNGVFAATVYAGEGWIAEITGLDKKFKFARKFVSEKDFSGASRSRKHGTVIRAHLESGKIYDISLRNSFSRSCRFYAQLDESKSGLRILSEKNVREAIASCTQDMAMMI